MGTSGRGDEAALAAAARRWLQRAREFGPGSGLAPGAVDQGVAAVVPPDLPLDARARIATRVRVDVPPDAPASLLVPDRTAAPSEVATVSRLAAAFVPESAGATAGRPPDCPRRPVPTSAPTPALRIDVRV